MDLTKVKLISSSITKLTFEDYLKSNNKNSSGFLRITLNRETDVDVNKNSMVMFFNAAITAFEGEETPNPADESKVFCLSVEFNLSYKGEFDVDNLTDEINSDIEWFFHKDASTVLHSVANRFLADTAYRNIHLPYQQ